MKYRIVRSFGKPAGMVLNPLIIWLVLLNAMCLVPWSFGPLTFAALGACVMLLYRWQKHGANGELPDFSSKAVKAGLTVLVFLNTAVVIFGLVANPDWLIDIGANTYAALEAFASGNNPYTSRAQLWVEQFPEGTPHVGFADGRITLFGVPYFHGYPYFPLMMLVYTPLYSVVDSYLAIRLTHVLLIAANLAGFWLFFAKVLTDRSLIKKAWLFATVAYLGVIRYALEAIYLGVTDLVISTFLVYGFIAMAYQRFFICGILLGCAQACKLLPAPLILLVVILVLWYSRAIGWVISGYVLSCTLFLLPFFLWHPEGFVSATILYYLSHHKGGDSTSLWYFLPESVQPVFLLAGLLLTLMTIILFVRQGKASIAAGLCAAFSGYAVFIIFSKMSHLNYLWGVLPLGSLGLTTLVFEKRYRWRVKEIKGTE